jgi:hypothetical protein
MSTPPPHPVEDHVPLRIGASVAGKSLGIERGRDVPIGDVVVPVSSAAVPNITFVSKTTHNGGRGDCAAELVANSHRSGHATV